MKLFLLLLSNAFCSFFQCEFVRKTLLGEKPTIFSFLKPDCCGKFSSHFFVVFSSNIFTSIYSKTLIYQYLL